MTADRYRALHKAPPPRDGSTLSLLFAMWDTSCYSVTVASVLMSEPTVEKIVLCCMREGARDSTINRSSNCQSMNTTEKSRAKLHVLLNIRDKQYLRQTISETNNIRDKQYPRQTISETNNIWDKQYLRQVISETNNIWDYSYIYIIIYSYY